MVEILLKLSITINRKKKHVYDENDWIFYEGAIDDNDCQVKRRSQNVDNLVVIHHRIYV